MAMATQERTMGISGAYPRPLSKGPDFADQRIAEQYAIPEYAWDRLPTSSKQHVRLMVRRSQGQRKARLVAILFALVLVLLILTGVALYLYGWPLPFLGR
jgi:hypothetical protein